MSRKTPARIPHFRPVSQNAYDSFVRRIYAAVPKDNRCADMLDALDKYLDGDRETYAAHLDEHTAITFEILRFDIDRAIERSARARRPRRRRNIEPQPQIESDVKSQIESDFKSQVKSQVKSQKTPQEESQKKSQVKPQKTPQEESPAIPRAQTQLDNMTQMTNPSTKTFEETPIQPTTEAPEETPPQPTAEAPEETQARPSTGAPETSSIPPRRIRRAAILSMRPKRKWKKIG